MARVYVIARIKGETGMGMNGTAFFFRGLLLDDEIRYDRYISSSSSPTFFLLLLLLLRI